MGVALELVLVPVLILLGVIVAAVWTNLSVGSIILGALLAALVVGGVVALLRYEWRVEEDEGVHEETGHTQDVQGRKSA